MYEKSALIRVASVSVLEACAWHVRKLALAAGKVWLYGPVEGADLHLAAAEEPERGPLIGVYTDIAPVKWIVEDIVNHARARGFSLEGVL